MRQLIPAQGLLLVTVGSLGSMGSAAFAQNMDAAGGHCAPPFEVGRHG
jgi:hypothetical protein